MSRPEVIDKEIDGEIQEPYELLTLDVEDAHQGKVMEALGDRRGELNSMQSDNKGRMRLVYRLATRALMGFRPLFLSMTSGTGVMSFGAAGYGPKLKYEIGQRKNGVMISNANGKAVGFALFNLQERGRLMVAPNDPVYEGMVVGLYSRDTDLTVNPIKEKKLTNMRASGKDDNILLDTPVRHTLEQALEFIDGDELVEVTPAAIRIRKVHLTENDRKRAGTGRMR